MSKLDQIITSHSMLNLTNTKAKRAVKDLLLELIDETVTNSKDGADTKEFIRQKVVEL